MSELVPVEKITGEIVFIRDHKVIFDRDFAELYGVETGQLTGLSEGTSIVFRRISCSRCRKRS